MFILPVYMSSSPQKCRFNKSLCAAAPAEGTQIFFGQQRTSDVMNSQEVLHLCLKLGRPSWLGTKTGKSPGLPVGWCEQNRAPQGSEHLFPEGLGVNGDGFGDCVFRGVAGRENEGARWRGHKTDRRGGEVIIGREVKVLLFRCVRQPQKSLCGRGLLLFLGCWVWSCCCFDPTEYVLKLQLETLHVDDKRSLI